MGPTTAVADTTTAVGGTVGAVRRDQASRPDWEETGREERRRLATGRELDEPEEVEGGPPPPALGRAPAGRDEQVAALFDEHRAGLCRLAALLLGDRAAAEEVVQEAFLRTFAGWRRVRQPERALGYLRAAVVNQCRSRARRRVTEDRGNRTVWAAEAGRVAHDVWSGDEAAESIRVLAAIRALPPRQREAVVLRYYADLSEADMAAALGCSAGTVKSQLAKARASLAQLLEEPDDRRGGGSGA